MRARHGFTEPIWGPEGAAGRGDPLPTTREPIDVAIVGAGIAGITAAYLLAKEGRRVAVFDPGPIGGAETGRTSGHLASAIDEHFVELEHLHGRGGARIAHASHAAAIDLIEQLVHAHEIDCGFARLPAYLMATDPGEREALQREVEAARRAGLDAHLVEGVPNLATARGPSVCYEAQARFEPMRYLAALASAARALGVRIYEARIERVQGRRKGQPAQVLPAGGHAPYAADAVIVATNTPGPIMDWAGIYFKQAAYRSYVIALKVPRGLIEDALYWDTLDPYHYARLRADSDEEDVLIVGGEDHRVGQLPHAVDPFARIERWARETYPGVGEVVTRWSGQIQEPLDGLAFIGRAPTKGDGVFVITGDSGNGLTHATLGARLVTDLVVGRDNPWAELYDPRRRRLRSMGWYVRENFNTGTHLLGALTPGDVASPAAIAPGCGAVVREGMHKLAVYRDPQGTLHACSAVCPHLRAIVEWNAIEHTWDCPAHGSRFSALGELLTGPATTDLPGAERRILPTREDDDERERKDADEHPPLHIAARTTR